MGRQQQPAVLDDILSENAITVSCQGVVAEIQSTANSNRILLDEVVYGEEVTTAKKISSQVKSKYIIIYSSDITNLHIGNHINVYGKLSSFTVPTNLGQFDEQFYYKIQNIDYKMMAQKYEITDASINYIKDAMFQLRKKMCSVYELAATEDTKGSLQAMLLGEKGVLEEETKTLYQVGGISHVLAISGMHITLLGMAIYECLFRLRGVRLAVFGTIVFVVLYGILTNFSISTNRAVVMMAIMLLARVFGRTYDLITTVSLSALIILLKQPMQIYQSGFLLSFGAVVGVGVVYPYMEEMCTERTGKFMKSVLFFLAIQLVTLPILLNTYFQVPTYSILLNLLVLPFMSLVVICGLLGGVIGCVSLNLGGMVMAGAIYILKGVRVLCELIYRLPEFYIVTGKPSRPVCLCYILLVVVGLLFLSRKKKLGFGWLAAAMIIMLLPTPNPRLTITMLDVGQGDGLFVESPSGNTYLIDGGSSDVKEVGRYRILPFVKARGYGKIDFILMSHGDSDHTSGIIELLEATKSSEISIGCLVLPYTSYEDEAYDSIRNLAKECGVEVRYLEAGDSFEDGELLFTCLHPSYEYQAASENDYSMTLKLSYHDFTMLFTGDMEGGAEEAIMAEYQLEDVDVLKVAHHGSKYSTSREWLEHVTPAVALISAGKSNRYGHPHEELLERLEEKSITILKTMESGAVTIETDGGEVKISEFLSGKD